MLPEKQVIEKRKATLQKQHDDLVAKINQGRDAIRQMEATVNGLVGAIQQCNWTLEQYKEKKDK